MVRVLSRPALGGRRASCRDAGCDLVFVRESQCAAHRLVWHAPLLARRFGLTPALVANVDGDVFATPAPTTESSTRPPKRPPRVLTWREISCEVRIRRRLTRMLRRCHVATDVRVLAAYRWPPTRASSSEDEVLSSTRSGSGVAGRTRRASAASKTFGAGQWRHLHRDPRDVLTWQRESEL